MSSYLLRSRRTGLALLAAAALACGAEAVKACPTPAQTEARQPASISQATAYAPAPAGGLEAGLPPDYDRPGGPECPTSPTT